MNNSKGIYPIDPRVAKAVSLENGELKVNGNTVGGKKLYRHRIIILHATGHDFSFDVIDANPTAYTAATFSQSANAIGRLPVTGVCTGNAGQKAIITKAESSAVQIKFTGYNYYDDDWTSATSTLTWADIASGGLFSDVVVEL